MEMTEAMNEVKSEYSKVDESVDETNGLLKAVIYENFGDKVGLLYSIVDDNDKFARILDALGGMDVGFPTVDKFKEAVTVSLVYYYKQVLNLSWSKIEELVPYERDICLRYGSKLKRLDKSLAKILSKKDKVGVERKEIFED